MEALFYIINPHGIITTLFIASRHARKDEATRASNRRSSSNKGLDLLFALALIFFIIPALFGGKGNKSGDSTGLGILILLIICGGGAALWYFH
ncbi:MAG: hypothetical protein JSS86_11310 [Cyanobacteria bacterium SZAS LIN-2]|nr:hypothetical protein [Cyanobacteria bacterium SZAS LIN-2]